MAQQHNIKSFRITIPQGETYGEGSWTIDHDVYIYHLRLTPVNMKHGDTGQLEMYVGETKVATFGEGGIHLDDSVMKVDFPQDDIVNFSNGIELRFVVNACDDTGRDLIIWVQYKE